MANEIKRPQLSDIKKLPPFFQDLYEKCKHSNKKGLTIETIRNLIAEIKLAYEMADYFLTHKISLGNIFNALDKRPDLFPSAKFVLPRERATAYFKAEHYIKSVMPQPVQIQKTSADIVLIRIKAAGMTRE